MPSRSAAALLIVLMSFARADDISVVEVEPDEVDRLVDERQVFRRDVG